MLKNSIVWGICAVAIFGALTVFGFMYTNKNKPYKEVEEKLIQAAKQYGEIKFSYNEAKDGLKITFDEMKTVGVIEDLNVKDETCEGYAVIKKNGLAYEYKGYLKCNDYTTKGY